MNILGRFDCEKVPDFTHQFQTRVFVPFGGAILDSGLRRRETRSVGQPNSPRAFAKPSTLRGIRPPFQSTFVCVAVGRWASPLDRSCTRFGRRCPLLNNLQGSLTLESIALLAHRLGKKRLLCADERCRYPQYTRTCSFLQNVRWNRSTKAPHACLPQIC